MAEPEMLRDRTPLSLSMTAEKSMSDQSFTWPYGKCLVGVVGRLDGPLEPPDLEAVKVARVEAVRLTSAAALEDVDKLRQVNPDIFITVEITGSGLSFPVTDRLIKPEDFSPFIQNRLHSFYERGVRYFELLSRPNAPQGPGLSWQNGSEFGAWLAEVISRLRSPYPEARFGYPGLVRHSGEVDSQLEWQRFLEQSNRAIDAANWIAVRCQWTTPELRESPAGGKLYEDYKSRYPNKLLLITEFGNMDPYVSRDKKAAEYLGYYDQLRELNNIGAAFSSALSSGKSSFAPIVWRLEDGNLTEIPSIIGARGQAQPPAAEDAEADADAEDVGGHGYGDRLFAENVQSNRPLKRKQKKEATQKAGADAETKESKEETAAPEPPEEVVAYHRFVNDQLPDVDQLNYDDYARAFAEVLTSDETTTPLTLGVYGAWGMGKSFLMRRIKEMIEKWPDSVKDSRPNAKKSKYDFHFIEFNAWVYSGSENLWAGLITKLYDGVENYLGQRRTFWFRLGKNFRKSGLKTLGLLSIYGLLAVLVSLLLDFNDWLAQWETLRLAITGLAGSAIGVSALAALPPLLNAIRELFSSVALKRSEQLAALSSRRDFRDKIGFMADIKSEITEIRELLEKGRNKKRPTRVVIVIDDLDRCPPAKAVEVLEAIMLLLADRDGSPFIVLLGLDARVIVKAVEERYGKVLTEAGITGYEYLDKIVQIPFRIPDPNPEARKAYVASLLTNPVAQKSQSPKSQIPGTARQTAAKPQIPTAQIPMEGQSSEPQAGQPPSGGSPGLQQGNAGKGGTEGTELRAGQQTKELADMKEMGEPSEKRTIEVSFTSSEQKTFERFARYLSANPRRIKRIINVYRVARLLPQKLSEAQRPKLIKWAILSEQWPFRLSWIIEEIENDEQQTPETEPGKLPPNRKHQAETTLSEVFAAIKPRLEANGAERSATIDGDPDLFEPFLAQAPVITVGDKWLQQLAFNLNPAVRREVVKAATPKPG